MATTEERQAAHDATLAPMHERLGNIEGRLTGLETRILAVGGFLGLLMTVYRFW